MINKYRHKLTLNEPFNYQIKVPGHLDQSWSGRTEGMTVTVESDDGQSVTTLTGNFDQAALQGLLRHLYSRGLPLISVICIDLC